MTPEQAAAFVSAQAAQMLVELEAMKAENESRRRQDKSDAYGEDEFLEAIRKSDAEREAAMPTYRAALHQASAARERLKKLGWSDGIYCPKDGTSFALVEWGSTGVHPGHYMGEWPTGDVYCNDFMVPPHAIMWKALDKLSDDERAALDASAADAKEFMERQFQAFSTCQE